MRKISIKIDSKEGVFGIVLAIDGVGGRSIHGSGTWNNITIPDTNVTLKVTAFGIKGESYTITAMQEDNSTQLVSKTVTLAGSTDDQQIDI